MRIAVDGNLMHGKKTGMGTVVYHILKYWKSTKDYTITVYTPEKLDDDYTQILEKNNIEIKVLGQANYLKWEQVVIPKAVKKDGAELLWCPYNTAPIKSPCKTIVTINDVIYMETPLSSAPSLYKKFGIIYRKHIVPIAVKKATKIITISEFAKVEIIRLFPKQKGKIHVIYLSADISGEKLSRKAQSSYFEANKIIKAFILGFGSLEMRKNSLRLIQAYEKLSADIQNKYQLVLFGFRGYKESEDFRYIKEHGLEKQVRVLGYVSDEEKATLYAESTLFVFPTLSEGFGIPVLEAFAASVPVITSNATSLPEVAGNAAVLVQPKYVNEIALAMENLLTNNMLCLELVQKGGAQLKKFDWRITAEKILEELLSCGGE